MEVAHLSILTAPFKTNLCMINNHFLSEKNVQGAAQNLLTGSPSEQGLQHSTGNEVKRQNSIFWRSQVILSLFRACEKKKGDTSLN